MDPALYGGGVGMAPSWGATLVGGGLQLVACGLRRGVVVERGSERAGVRAGVPSAL